MYVLFEVAHTTEEITENADILGPTSELSKYANLG